MLSCISFFLQHVVTTLGSRERKHALPEKVSAKNQDIVLVDCQPFTFNVVLTLQLSRGEIWVVLDDIITQSSDVFVSYLSIPSAQ